MKLLCSKVGFEWRFYPSEVGSVEVSDKERDDMPRYEGEWDVSRSEDKDEDGECLET